MDILSRVWVKIIVTIIVQSAICCLKEGIVHQTSSIIVKTIIGKMAPTVLPTLFIANTSRHDKYVYCNTLYIYIYILHTYICLGK